MNVSQTPRRHGIPGSVQEGSRILSVILQVRVLNDDHVACSCLETSTQRCSFPKIALLQQEFIDPPEGFALSSSLVPSVDPSSTMMISTSSTAAERTASTTASIVARSL